MSDTTHTPGPWRISENQPYPDGTPYHFIESGDGYFDKEKGGFRLGFLGSEADAHLIAMAPELDKKLEAAERRIEELESALEELIKAQATKRIHDDLEMWERAESALAKNEETQS